MPFAQENGIFDKYVEVVFKSMWVDNKKMDDLEVIQTVLLENGLPVKEIFGEPRSKNKRQAY